MPGGGVRVEGLRQVVKGLEDLGVSVDDLKEAFGPIAAQAARVAAGYVHSQTGALAGSVRGNRAKSRAVVTTGRTSVPYAGAQNYGWPRRNIEAQGFYAKTDEVMEPLAIGLIESALEAAIRRSGL